MNSQTNGEQKDSGNKRLKS